MKARDLGTAAAIILLLGCIITATVVGYCRVKGGFDGDQLKTVSGLLLPAFVASSVEALRSFVSPTKSTKVFSKTGAAVIATVTCICSFAPGLLAWLQAKSLLHLMFEDFAIMIGAVQAVFVTHMGIIRRSLF